MAYRSDLDALEARYRALTADVEQRTRERDEVGRMVAEARERHDRALDDLLRRQRQRSQHRVAISVIATTTLVVAGILGMGIATAHRHRSQEAVLEKFAQFTDRMCECTTKDCADRVQDDVTHWATEMEKISGDFDQPNTELTKRLTEVVTRYGDCMVKVLSIGEQP